MIKKTITYENFNGVPTSETFYFHMSQAELLHLEVSTKGGLQQKLLSMVEANDGAAIMEFIETFIKGSYGKKTEDGSRFNKTQEILDDFVSSPAYDTLFMELCTDPEKAAEFLNGIVPKEMAANVQRLSKLEQVKNSPHVKKIEEAQARSKEFDPREGGNAFEQDERVPVPLSEVDENPAPIGLSLKEAREMDQDEFYRGLEQGRFYISS